MIYGSTFEEFSCCQVVAGVYPPVASHVTLCFQLSSRLLDTEKIVHLEDSCYI